jgi:hypothetical protein
MTAEDASPVLVAVLVIAILVVTQPLNGTLGGISLNWIGVALVAVGGLLGLSQ